MEIPSGDSILGLFDNGFDFDIFDDSGNNLSRTASNEREKVGGIQVISVVDVDQVIQDFPTVQVVQEDGIVDVGQVSVQDVLIQEAVLEEVLPDAGHVLAEGQDDAQQVALNNEGTRKRQKNLSKQDKAKYALNRGLEHLNPKGKLIKARAMGNGCHPTLCRFKCHNKVTEIKRQEMFKGFWALGNKTSQQNFLRSMLNVSNPAVHTSQENLKENSVKYFFHIDKQLVRVCKKTFLDTFDISESWTRTIMKKIKQGVGGTISPDKRGKHSKVNEDVRLKSIRNVMDHIKSFRCVPSHLCRARSKRKYLDRRLNIRRMYGLYKVWMRSNRPEDSIRGEKFYRNIFNTRFNLGFHRPKKDLCDLCTVYDLSSAAMRAKLQDKYDLHISNKAKAKAARKKDKEKAKQDKTICYGIFDLQKVLICPKVDNSAAYYMRKLNVLNFTVYDVLKHQGFCYPWDESEAARGANEIATCVFFFIEIKVKEGILVFIFWSDNCGGQNKNKYLFSMYTYAAAKFNVNIYHRFLEKGHTMNEADSMHATIERAGKCESVYKPQGWYDIMRDCKQTGSKYEVTPVGQKILDFHPLADYFQQWQIKGANWSKVRDVKILAAEKGKVFVRYDFAEEYKELKITKRGRQVNLETYEPPKAYQGQRPIRAAKLQNLASMCNDLTIPVEHHAFYKALQDFPDLDNPLLEEEYEDEESDNEDDPENVNPDFLWEGEDENNDSDYEEQLGRLRKERGETRSESEGGETEDETLDALNDGVNNDDSDDPDFVP